MSLSIAVLTISDTRGLAEDRSGDLLVAKLTEAGHRLADRELLPDDRFLLRAKVSNWLIDPSVDVILTTGGTGFTGRDTTPEALLPLFDKVIEGFGELFRQLSFAEIGASTIQSRAVAGIANGRIVFCLPGSSGACRLAFDQIIRPQLDATTKPCNLAVLRERFLER
ncbi:molybdenum cofactor biosynthesis protein B [Ahniella affigens]|uniref:Molybdenum cofactor biosynthesis protein B n=1 Tax=Ahniella affigens TaxID=2021234 RepID=A0A2P1PTI1_9GAMM|nr:molybdenum cofactor biosynthesis protein B [Ahniella affigens]AVP98153.1 molybdenum cofactor biosynthesis protein B [Ahniella affigens]